VFTRTKHGANRLAKQLEQDVLSATAIHGNKSQGARTRALADFKRGDVRVLVATDIAARGLDIDQLPHVVNFELPNVPEDYVHRIGRTGRAGHGGTAVSLVSGEETGMLRDIERLIRRQIPHQALPGYEPAARQSPEPRELRERRGRNGARRNAGSAQPGRKAHANESSRNGGHARAGKSGQANGAPGRRDRPAVTAPRDRRPAPQDHTGKPGFRPLSERLFTDWDVN
jgi:ATP-dependent RNA helicase RhlE